METTFDDIFAEQPKQAENRTLEPFDREAWVEQKKQARDKAYAMIDDTALRMESNSELFQTYLDVSARFDRYSVGNAILVTAQKPDATRLAAFETWKENGAYIRKGAIAVSILEPGDEYTKADGTTGVRYNLRRVFDISQTSAKQKAAAPQTVDSRMLLKALIHDAPCKFEITDDLREGVNAIYRPENRTIYVRRGMEAPDLFRAISYELAHAHLDQGEGYRRSDSAFPAYCISYVLCKRYHIAEDKFRFERMPEGMSAMEAPEFRAILQEIRDTANDISLNMNKTLDRARGAQETAARTEEAR